MFFGGVPYCQRTSSDESRHQYADVKRRTCQDLVCLQVLVQVIGEAVNLAIADIAINLSNRQIHQTQAACCRVRLLPIDSAENRS